MHQGQNTFRILHVDPDGAATTATADGLQAEDARLATTAVHTAAEAVQLLSTGAFDCLLSEYELPEQDGADLLADMRDRECRLPVIFYTSADVSTVATEALAAGAADCIQKDAGDAHYALLANRIRNAVAATTAERAQQRRSKALNLTDSGIAVVDGEGRYSFVNEAYADRYGYDADEMVGRRWELTVPASEEEVIRTEVLPAVREGDTWQGTTSGLRADGSTFRAETTFAQTSAGGFVCVVPSDAEGSERPATVRQLHSTACELMEATTVDEVAEIAVSAATGILTAPACAVYRYDEATDGLSLVAESRPGGEAGTGHAERLQGDAIAWQAYESGDPQIHPDRAESPQQFDSAPGGRSRVALPLADWGVLSVASGTPDAFTDTDVSVTQMLASGVEIAVQQVQQTERITEDRELLSAQLNATVDGHLVVGSDGEALSYDQQVLDMWGGTEELVKDSTDTELLDFAADRLENSDLLRRRVDELYANPSETSRDELYLTDGRVFESYSAPVEDTGGEYFARLWTFRDITDQKERERRLNALLERTNARIYIRDRDGIYQLSNRAHAAGLGFERDEVVGSHATDVLEPTSAKRSLLSDQHIFAAGEPLKTEAVRTIQGERQVFISEKYPYRIGGEIVGVVAIAREITDRKEREEQISRQNRRLKEFASIVSHDLRNPLAVADGQLRIAQQESDCEHIGKALAAIERGEALVDDLLTLVRSGDDVGSFEPVTLPEVGKACWNSVETPGMTLDVQTDRTIRADAGRLRQVLENLYRNAAEHGGTTVRIGDTEDGFYIEDDGPGLEDTETTEVFEAGYTTSEDGTGFGLRIVKQIVTAHGWEITATEGELGGARFEIDGVEGAELD